MTTVWYQDGAGSPRTDPRTAARAAGVADDGPVDVTVGWTIERHDWLEDPSLRLRTLLAGYALSAGVRSGRILPLPVRLSAVPSMIVDEAPDVAVVSGIRRGDRLAFGDSVAWADVLAATATRVVVEVDETGVDLGGPEIAGNIVAQVARPPGPDRPPAAARPADDVDLRIGALVASMLPDEPTLQVGPGGIGEGIVRALTRPVRLWSGLLTDAMAELSARDLLLGDAVATYTWGGAPIRELAAAGRLRLLPCTVTHDLTALSAIPRYVACNTAVQVGLDGSVNVERVAGRVIASVGGHADFCTGASRSCGGLSIVALRATGPDGSSTIVPAVDVVSTPRCDVDVVVTEHGIADLRGSDGAERARRLVGIAAPGHREALAATSLAS